MTTQYDYGAFQGGDTVGDNLMSRIEGLAQEQLDAEMRVDHLTEQLAEAKATHRILAEKKMPELLDEADLGESEIVTPAGHKIKLHEVIRGSIPKGNEEAAFKWLEDNHNANLIKRTFAIEFGKDQEKWADKFERDCNQRKKALNIKRKKGVHAGTLQAFIKKSLDDGVPIPLDVFGAYRQRFAKIKMKV